MMAVWRCEPRSHGRDMAATPLPGRRPSVSMPHRSVSLALYVSLRARSIFSAPGGVLVWLVGCFPPRGRTCVRGWPARVQAPRAGGTAGARVQGRSRWPQAFPGLCKASAGAAAWAAVARRVCCGVVRCTASGRSASACAGCVPRSREAAGRAIAQSKRNASGIMMSSRKSHRNAYRKSHDVVLVIHVGRAANCSSS